MGADYSPVTERAGDRAHREQLEIIHTRYAWAAGQAAGKDVLEVACGSGRALGFLAARARSVVGGDYTRALLEAGRGHYRDRFPLLQIDAQSLPFKEASFDLVIFFEAIYYLPDAEMFFREAWRVLRPGGSLLISSSNRERPDFIPSPYSTRYWSASELAATLSATGFRTELLAAFPAAPTTGLGRVVSSLRRVSASLGLTPKSMRGKAWLKRLFYGPLASLGPEIDTSVPAHALTPLAGASPVGGFQLIYAGAVKPA